MDFITRFAKHHLIGLGFWQAWQMVVLCTNAVVTPQADQQGLTLAIILTTTLGYLAFMVACRFTKLILEGKGAVVVAAASMSVGTFMLMLAPAVSTQSLSFASLAMALTAVSYGNAALLFMWGELWSTLATGRVGRHLYLSYAFAFVLFFIAYLLPYPVGGIFCCLFPIASCLILVSCKNEPRRKPLATPFRPEKSLIAKAICFIFLLSVIWGSSQSLIPTIFASGQTTEFVAMGMVVAGVTIGAFALNLTLTSPENEAVALYRPVIPAMAAGFAALFALPESGAFIGNGLLTMGIYCLDMFIMLTSTDIAFRARIPSPISFGVAIVSSRIGTFVGSSAMHALVSEPSSIALYSETALAAVAVCLATLVFAGTIIFTQVDLQKLYMSPFPSEKDHSDGKNQLTTTQRCRLVADAASLTAREAEVLELLVRGRTIQGLCDELSIAQGTAKHHVSNIYRKLGVGDRRSVFDIVEQAGQEPEGH